MSKQELTQIAKEVSILCSTFISGATDEISFKERMVTISDEIFDNHRPHPRSIKRHHLPTHLSRFEQIPSFKHLIQLLANENGDVAIFEGSKVTYKRKDNKYDTSVADGLDEMVNFKNIDNKSYDGPEIKQNSGMIDIETATLEELEAELEECHQAWGKYSCDCFGFYISALQKQISNLKQ